MITKSLVPIINDDNDSSIGESWFFGIGINDYYSPIPKLNNAKKDVIDILDILEKRYVVDKAVLLFNEKATREAIINQFVDLKSKLKPQDKLVIYFAGHGEIDEKHSGYWLPVDAKAKNIATYIPNVIVREYMSIINAKHILLISDSCFSGTLLRNIPSYESIAIEELEKNPSRWVLSSGREKEKVFDGNDNSPFAASLIQALANNEKKGLNISLLHDQVMKSTAYRVFESTSSIRSQVPQIAPLYNDKHEDGQYIFRLKTGSQKIKIVKSTEYTSNVTVLGINFILVSIGISPLGKNNRKPFYIADTLLSESQWNNVLGGDISGKNVHLAKTNLSVEDINTFIEHANEDLNYTYRIGIPHISQLRYCIDFVNYQRIEMIEAELKKGVATTQALYDLIGIAFQICKTDNFYTAIGGSFWGQFNFNGKPPEMEITSTQDRDVNIGFRPILIL